MFSIDDEEDPLDAMFSSVTNGAAIGATDMMNVEQAPKAKSSVDDDLSWLDDDTSIAAPGSTNSHVGISSPVVDHLNTASVDDFLSEVFGNTSTGNHDINDITHDATDSFLSSIVGNGQDSFSASANTSISGIEAEIQSIVDSSDPDIDHLRLLLLHARSIPCSLRAKIWCLLITGQVPDVSLPLTGSGIDQWDIRSSLEMNYKDDVISDCRAVIDSATTRHRYREVGTDCVDEIPVDRNAEIVRGEADAAVLINVLAYHCVKYDVPYSSCYSYSSSDDDEPTAGPITSATIFSVLYPLIALQRQQQQQQQHKDSSDSSITSPLELELLSQCYCALQSQFYPLMHCPPAAKTMALRSLCNMVRLLLRYHCPVLANKLDSEVPNWWQLRESPTSSKGTGACGCLCETWLVSYFSATVPPEMTCLLLDWSILTREAMTGVYAITALLYVFAEPLMTMSGEEVRGWFDALAGVSETQTPTQEEWYKLLTVFLELPVTATTVKKEYVAFDELLDTETAMNVNMGVGVGEDVGVGPGGSGSSGDGVCALSTADLTWPEFMNGWVFALQTLRQATPNSFCRAVDGLEEWCTDRVSAETIGRADGGVGAGGMSTRGSGGERERNGEFTPCNSSQRFLYTTAEEVVPSLCSNLANRQPRGQLKSAGDGDDGKDNCGSSNCKERFFAGVQESRNRQQQEGEHRVTAAAGLFPVVSLESESNPGSAADSLLYFAVDCRSEAQKVLGSFPKAYALNVEDIKTTLDGELDPHSPVLQELLEVLGPLADCSHICLLGAGYNMFVPGTPDPQAPATRPEVTTMNTGAHPFQRSLSPSIPSPLAGVSAGTGVTSTAGIYSASSLLNNPNINALGSSLFSAAKALSQQVQVGVAGLSGQDTAADAASYRLYVRDLDRVLPQLADFFVSRQFRHLSILEGGYTAALQHLHAHNHSHSRHAYNIDSVLTGVDKPQLQSFVQGQRSLAGICWRPPIKSTGTTSSACRGNSLSPSVGASSRDSDTAVKYTLDDGDIGTGNWASSMTWTDTPLEPSTATVAPISPVSSTGTGTGANTSAGTGTSLFTGVSSPLGGVSSAATVDAAKLMAGAIGKRLSIFGAASYDNIRKGVTAISAEVEAKRAQIAAQQLALAKQQEEALELRQIEEEEARARVRENPSFRFAHTSANTPQKSEQEKEMALAMHTLAGVGIGDKLLISRETLPGAVLFPALVYVNNSVDDVGSEGALQCAKKEEEPTAGVEETEVGSNKPVGSDDGATAVPSVAVAVPASISVGKHRFLVVTPERFIILDAKGGGVGSEATVEANHHLTELVKITFRKRDPELVNIFFVNLDAKLNALATPEKRSAAGADVPSNAIQFRVVRRKEFVETLQKNLERFK